jgi:hypothetical protein
MRVATIIDDLRLEGDKRNYYFDFFKAHSFVSEKKVELDSANEEFWSKVRIVEKIEDADVFVLPLAFNYYVKYKLIHLIDEYVVLAKKHKVPFVLWVSGDQGVKVPYSDIFVLRQSGYQSKRLKNQHAMPVFFTDPRKAFSNPDLPLYKSYANLPTIGFCGQADKRQVRRIFDVGRIFLRNFLFKIGKRIDEPQALIATTYQRARILSYLQSTKQVIANFILRTRYRAGVKDQDDLNRTSKEYYDNMLSSDYILCFRGGGNFSSRFYETLAMGRIPLRIESDDILPFDGIIDWSKHAMSLPFKQVDRIGEHLFQFHQKISPVDFEALQKANRILWEKYINLHGFFYVYFTEVVLTKDIDVTKAS